MFVSSWVWMEPLLGVQQFMKMSSSPPPHSPSLESPLKIYLYFLIIFGAKKVMGARPGGRNVNIVLEIEYTFLVAMAYYNL
jgi:hypothetical protein